MVDVLQGSFTGGELSPNLYSRVDLARWATSLKKCRNWVTSPWGGTKVRRGSKLATLTKEMAEQLTVNILPFQFNSEQGYLLEFGHLYLRIIQNGAPIIATAAPAWVTATAYAEGDRVSSGGYNYRCVFAHTSGVSFAVGDGWVYESEIGEPYEIETPYTFEQVMALDYAQSADVMTIVHPEHAPYGLSRYGTTDWRLEKHAIVSGPFENINTDKALSVWANADSGTVTLYSTGPIFTDNRIGGLFYLRQEGFSVPWETGRSVAVGDVRRSDGKYYEAVSAGVTGTLRPTHLEDSWSDGGVIWRYRNNGYGVAEITAVAGDGKSCTAEVKTMLPKATVTTGYGLPQTITGLSYGGGVLNLVFSGGHGLTAGQEFKGYVDFVIVIHGDHYPVRFVDYLSYIDATTLRCRSVSSYPYYLGTFISGTASLEGALLVGASKVWAFGAWGLVNGYPSTVNYHQGRRIYAGAPGLPQTLWMSRSDQYNDFSESSPLQDDDAQAITLVSGEINPIVGTLSMGKLLTFTSGAYWTLGSDGKTPIGIGTLVPDLQGYVGASKIRPLGVAESALFVRDGGGAVSDVAYNFSEDKHVADDLNLSADHLTDGYTIVSWVYQRRPFGIVWCVRSDGKMLGLTYNRKQAVVGWHQHDTEGGQYLACAMVRENGVEVLYTLVDRGKSSLYIEYTKDPVSKSLDDGVFTDSSLSYDANDKTILTIHNNTYDHTNTRIELTGGTVWDESEALTATADGPLFYADDIGAELRIFGRRFTIEGITSTAVATVRADSQLPPTFYPDLIGKSWLLARKKFFMEHLMGFTVSALADGSAELGLPVGNFGEINLSQPALRVTIGLPIEADLETLELATTQGETLVNKLKRIGKLTAQVVETRGLMVGRDFDHLMPIKELMPTLYNQAPSLRTGIVSASFPTAVSTNGSVCVRQKYPLPATITSIIPDVEVSGA